MKGKKVENIFRIMNYTKFCIQDLENHNRKIDKMGFIRILNTCLLYGYTPFFSFIYQLMDILVVSTFLAIMENVMNISVQVFVDICPHFSLIYMLRVEFLNHMVTWETIKLFSKWLFYLTFLPAVNESFGFSTSSSTL